MERVIINKYQQNNTYIIFNINQYKSVIGTTIIFFDRNQSFCFAGPRPAYILPSSEDEEEQWNEKSLYFTGVREGPLSIKVTAPHAPFLEVAEAGKFIGITTRALHYAVPRKGCRRELFEGGLPLPAGMNRQSGFMIIRLPQSARSVVKNSVTGPGKAIILPYPEIF